MCRRSGGRKSRWRARAHHLLVVVKPLLLSLPLLLLFVLRFQLFRLILAGDGGEAAADFGGDEAPLVIFVLFDGAAKTVDLSRGHGQSVLSFQIESREEKKKKKKRKEDDLPCRRSR